MGEEWKYVRVAATRGEQGALFHPAEDSAKDPAEDPAERLELIGDRSRGRCWSAAAPSWMPSSFDGF